MLCVATVAYEEFFHRRNGWIRNALVAETLDVLRLDGVYHDIAFAISGLECFNWHEPGPDDIGHGINPQPGTRHLHNGRFQVGNGGFIGATKRRLALETVYGRSDHFKGTPRKMVFGTESIVEFLIDAVDYYSTVDSLGPYKPYYLNFDVRALQPILESARKNPRDPAASIRL
ncbi:MAG: hypothetical protein M5R36_28630 [Deltaproteobacteria bacterium]|nr:hypothetical protein [Deltaproteobacteria bacterium]